MFIYYFIQYIHCTRFMTLKCRVGCAYQIDEIASIFCPVGKVFTSRTKGKHPHAIQIHNACVSKQVSFAIFTNTSVAKVF